MTVCTAPLLASHELLLTVRVGSEDVRPQRVVPRERVDSVHAAEGDVDRRRCGREGEGAVLIGGPDWWGELSARLAPRLHGEVPMQGDEERACREGRHGGEVFVE